MSNFPIISSFILRRFTDSNKKANFALKTNREPRASIEVCGARRENEETSEIGGEMKIGEYEIDVVETSIFRLDGGAMFGVVPKVFWSAAYDDGDEKNRIPLAARPLLIRFGERKVLIDAGNGDKANEKFAKIYSIDLEKSRVEKALEKLGANPEEITDVVITHLHFDHAGGATKYENGRLTPTFPNAKYYVQKSQYEWALRPSEKDRASFLKENFEPLRNAGVLELLDGDAELFPGAELITVNGHTRGMQLLKLSSGSTTVLFCADLIPTSAHIPIPYVMGYDNFPLTTIEEKKKILTEAAENDWILIFEHDAFRQASKVVKTEKGFQKGEDVVITPIFADDALEK